MYPSAEDIVALHHKHASNDEAFNLIFTHCQIVRDIAFSLIRKNHLTGINIALVETGALLHDIGTYSLYKNGSFNKELYITHGIRGYEILKKAGYPEDLCRIASNHIGAGITKQMISKDKLPLPENDYTAESIEEKLVMYADKFHSKTPKFNRYESYLEFSKRFSPAVTERFKTLAREFGFPDLEYFSKKYGHPIL